MAEAAAVLARDQESFDHLGTAKVAAKLLKLLQPEVVTVEIGVGWIAGIPLQVAKVLHQDEGGI